jgi:hypothetical protein
MSRRRYIVEREISLNHAEVSALRRLLAMAQRALPDTSPAYAAYPLLDRIDRKLERMTRNWPMP